MQNGDNCADAVGTLMKGNENNNNNKNNNNEIRGENAARHVNLVHTYNCGQ